MTSERGTTLIELVATLALAALVTSSLYVLLGTGIKGRLIVEARLADQEAGRQAVTWLADRIRQVSYDALAACPDGMLRIGSGRGFAERLAFRAVLDQTLDPPRRTYVYYVEGRRLWQETLTQEERRECSDELGRSTPDPGRLAITPAIIEHIDFTPLDAQGARTTSPSAVRLIRIRLVVQMPSAPGRKEAQTYETLAAVRGP